MPIIQSSPLPIPKLDRDGDTVMSGTKSLKSIQSQFTFDFPSQVDDLSSSPRSPILTATKPSTTSFLSTLSSLEKPREFLPNSPSTAAKERPKQAVNLPPHPPKPLSWMWQCHLCHSRYPLHVTRRCLIDGHYYCSGDPNASPQRNVRRKKRGQSCSSEFDYVGWQDWGKWRKKTLALLAYAHRKAAPVLRGCDSCEYPSECRYEKKASEEVLDMDKYLDPVTEVTNEDKATFSKADDTCKNIDHQSVEEEPKLGFELKVVDVAATQITSLNDFAVLSFDGSNRFYANISNNLSSPNLSNPDSAASRQSVEPSKRSTTSSSSLPSSSRSTSTLNSKLYRSQVNLATVETKLKVALAEEKLRLEQQRKNRLKQKNTSRAIALGFSDLPSEQMLSTNPFDGTKQSQNTSDLTASCTSWSSTAPPNADHPITNKSASRWKKRRSNVSDFEDIALSPESGQSVEAQAATFPSKSQAPIASSKVLSSSSWSSMTMFGRLGKSAGTSAEG